MRSIGDLSRLCLVALMPCCCSCICRNAEMRVVSEEYSLVEEKYVEYVESDSSLEEGQKRNRVGHARELGSLIEELAR